MAKYWTMRARFLLLVLLFLLGQVSCALRTPPPSVTGAASPVASAPRDFARDGARRSPSDARNQRLIHIASFDCEKHETFPGRPAQRGDVTPANGIRYWHGGGPGGSNWNVEDLRCSVRATTSCTRGRVDVILRVGKAIVAERPVDLTGGQVDVEMSLAQKVWRGQVDERSEILADTLFQTAAFRSFVALTCTSPFEATYRDSRYLDVTDDDSFVAGFASGE
jgi:hypothetical protein